MHQQAQSEFEEAVERFHSAERALTAATEALRVLELRSAQLEWIQNTVADFFGLHPGDMKSSRRPNRVAHPRQIAMALARRHTKHSLEEIGAAFGGRDPGTVAHACQAVGDRIDVYPVIAAQFTELDSKVREALGVQSHPQTVSQKTSRDRSENRTAKSA